MLTQLGLAKAKQRRPSRTVGELFYRYLSATGPSCWVTAVLRVASESVSRIIEWAVDTIPDDYPSHKRKCS